METAVAHDDFTASSEPVHLSTVLDDLAAGRAAKRPADYAELIDGTLTAARDVLSGIAASARHVAARPQLIQEAQTALEVALDIHAAVLLRILRDDPGARP